MRTSKVFWIWDLDFFSAEVIRIGPFATAEGAEKYAEDELTEEHQFMISRNDTPKREKPKASNKEV